MKKQKGTRRARRKLPLVLSKEQIGAMIANCSITSKTGTRTRGLIAAFAGAGLRCDEATSLRPCDIKWAEGLIEVRNGKGGRDRCVPVHTSDLAYLRAWDEKRPQGARWFFTTHKGTRLSNRYVRDAIKRSAIRAQLDQAEEVHPHTLRHSFATLKLEEGYTQAEVRDLLGHARTSTTDVYLHTRPKRNEDSEPMCPPLLDKEPTPESDHSVLGQLGGQKETPEQGEADALLADWRSLSSSSQIHVFQVMASELGTKMTQVLMGT